MPVIWERYDKNLTVATQNSSTAFELFHNEVDDHYFQNAPITIVDGILTVITDTDDLVVVRLIIMHEIVINTDIGIDSPNPGERSVYYEWFAARGPLVFRLRSKKTIQPQEKLWIVLGKAATGGSNSTIIHAGLLTLLQRS